MPGARRLLTHLDAHGVRYGLATSTLAASRGTPSDDADGARLEKMSCVVTGCAVMRAKPDPEIFTRAREALGVEAEACVVVEDTRDGGVRAARRVAS